jgi:prevent-host-death family protein
MEEIPTGEARKNLADLINRVSYGKERVLLTRHGRAVAALVPIEDVNALERLRRRMRARAVERAEREAEAGRSIPWDMLRADLEP